MSERSRNFEIIERTGSKVAAALAAGALLLPGCSVGASESSESQTATPSSASTETAQDDIDSLGYVAPGEVPTVDQVARVTDLAGHCALYSIGAYRYEDETSGATHTVSRPLVAVDNNIVGSGPTECNASTVSVGMSSEVRAFVLTGATEGGTQVFEEVPVESDTETATRLGGEGVGFAQTIQGMLFDSRDKRTKEGVVEAIFTDKDAKMHPLACQVSGDAVEQDLQEVLSATPEELNCQ